MDRASILIVEDHDSTRRMYAKALEHRGYRILEAANGEEGVQLARLHLPDLIIMDIAMPVLDAWEAMRLLKGGPETASIPVIALSGHSTEGDREGAMLVGFRSFLPKPCEPRQLAEEVLQLIGPAERPTD